MKFVYAFLLILIFGACASDDKPVIVEKKDTKSLVIEAQSKLDPLSISYSLNAERAAEYLEESKTLTGIPKLNKLIKYSTEMLNSGETKPAIAMMESVIKETEQTNIDNKAKAILAMNRMLAIAHIRLGEQENCIQKHNHESCIIPIQEDGIHTLTQGSGKAIAILKEMLAANPRNAEAIWILNLAYMTLGQYPDKVPPPFLLPAEYFEKNKDRIARFDNIASEMGIGHDLLSGGVIIEDFDNDGDLDIFCTSWGFTDNVIYYENDGAGSFTDMTTQKGLDGHTGGLNVKQTDYNNDGLIDIYIMRGAWMMAKGAIPNTLLKNTGKGFEDVTLDVGLTKHSPTQACEWIDIDKDGWLDLLVFNESMKGGDYPTQLWMNNNGERFVDVGSDAGLTHRGFFKAISVGDINNDGEPDIYVSSLKSKNLLYLNQGLNAQGIPQFVEAGERIGVTNPVISFPTMMFDFNNDGLLDILVSSYQSSIDNPAADFALNIKGVPTGGETMLYINNGNETFTEVHNQVGMNEAMYTMGCNYGDLDNDGWLDIYLGTGDPSFFSIVPNKVFLNESGRSLTDVSYASGMAHIQKGHGVSMTDLDRDGNVDVYAVMGGAYEGDNFQNAFFHNPGSDNNSVTIKLIGTNSNKLAIGAKMKLTITDDGKERVLYRIIGSGASFGSNSLETVVGVGQATKIDKIEIVWPSNNSQLQTISNLDVNSYYIITEGKKEVEKKERNPVDFKLDKMHTHHHH